MRIPVRNVEGEEVRQLEVDENVFGIEPNIAVVHQAFLAQRAAQRWGTAQTKTRGEVQGSTRKIRAQKYTGRARQGSLRAPHRVGGGIVFGPRVRDYTQKLPKKMRRLAIRSALSGKLASGHLTVIEGLDFEAPKTKEVVRILRNLGIERSPLIVTAEPDRKVLNSARNLPKAKVLPAAYLNVLDMVTHRDLLMTEGAVQAAERLWGRKAEPGEMEARASDAAAAVELAPAEALPRRRTRKAVISEEAAQDA